MFGLFSTRCPLDTYEKTWIEWRMRWLADQFGVDRLLCAKVVLPTDDFFPDAYGATPEDARKFLDRLCGFLAINPQTIRLEVCPDVQLPGTAGHYDHSSEADSGQRTIRIAESGLADPEKLVATLAHELAHELLLGGRHINPDAPDHEWVTDLLPVFFGLGIFAANATIREGYKRSTYWYWWSASQHGYLPARMFGYAMALFAFMRDEQNPPWARFLRLDASSALRDGLYYLQRTEDTLFHPDTIRAKRTALLATDLSARLSEGTPSVRLSTLWEIRDHPRSEAITVAAVTECLASRDYAIAAGAARTLAVLDPAAGSAITDLVAALASDSAELRAAAAYALGVLKANPETVIPELAVSLEDESTGVIVEAVIALGCYGLQAGSAAPKVLAALEAALIDCHYRLANLLTATLKQLVPDPVARISHYFAERDPELLSRAQESLGGQQQSCEEAQPTE
jgi:HEAT repeats